MIKAWLAHTGKTTGSAPIPVSYTHLAALASERKSQVGTGDRSERIRTYNYPQGRVTDHRIGLTLYKLEQILNGDLDELIDALITSDQAEKLKGAQS